MYSQKLHYFFMSLFLYLYLTHWNINLMKAGIMSTFLSAILQHLE